LGTGGALFAVPIVFKLHDGIEAVETESPALTLVDQMAALCIRHMSAGSYVLLDAYYASAKVLQPFRQHGLHLISRVRISTLAYAPLVLFLASTVGDDHANGAVQFN